MCERIKRRNLRAKIDEHVEEQRNGNRDSGEDANPSMTEDHSDKRSEICEQHADEGRSRQGHTVTNSSEEILCDTTNEITKSRLPANR